MASSSILFFGSLSKVFFASLNGNADVERSLSADKKTVTPDRASLSVVTIQEMDLSKIMCSCVKSHTMFTLRKNFFLSNKKGSQSIWKKALKRKGTIKEKGHSRWKDGKTTGSPEAGTKETKLV